MQKKVIALVVLLVAAGSATGAWWLYHGTSGGGKCAALWKALPRAVRLEAPVAVPDTAFAREDGAAATLADYAGRGVVLNFWATWCAPCVREMPALDRARALLAARGVEVLAVSNDRGGAEIVRAFYAENAVVHLPALTDSNLALARRFGVRGLPTTAFIDAGGRVLGHVEGAAEWDREPIPTALRQCLGPETGGNE